MLMMLSGLSGTVLTYCARTWADTPPEPVSNLLGVFVPETDAHSNSRQSDGPPASNHKQRIDCLYHSTKFSLTGGVGHYRRRHCTTPPSLCQPEWPGPFRQNPDSFLGNFGPRSHPYSPRRRSSRSPASCPVHGCGLPILQLHGCIQRQFGQDYSPSGCSPGCRRTGCPRPDPTRYADTGRSCTPPTEPAP